MTRAQTRWDETGLELKHQCPACGAWYKPSRRDQVYCDRACKQHGFRERAKFQKGNKPDPLDHRLDPIVPRET